MVQSKFKITFLPMTSPQHLAEACAQSMWSNDNASRNLGMKIEEISPGHAVLSMEVRDDMTNGQDLTHGGYIFTLADSAFAFACNSYNRFTVAQHCSITFVAPSFLGDRLTARAKERNRGDRSGIYDVTVTNQDGKVVAEFRGNSRTVKGQHVDTA